MLRFERLISAVDTHTAGEPTRTITGGFPRIPGKTVGERWFCARPWTSPHNGNV